jgi:hypothetical protein
MGYLHLMDDVLVVWKEQVVVVVVVIKYFLGKFLLK